MQTQRKAISGTEGAENRNGRTGGKVGFVYRALFNCFEEETTYTARNIYRDFCEAADEAGAFIPAE